MKRRFLFFGGLALLVLLALVVGYAGDRGTSVVVCDSEGRVMSRHQLPTSGDFEIEYVHSYYEAPATESFVAGKDGSFKLVEVSSSSEAVIDYYELEGHKEAGDDLSRLVLEEPQRFEALPLIGTAKGQRTLVVSNERFPLYAEDGPQHLVIRVEEDTFFMRVRGLLDG